MTDHHDPSLDDPADPLERIGRLAAAVAVPDAPAPTDIHRRATRRRRTRAGAVAASGIAAASLVVALFAGALTPTGDTVVDTASVPPAPGPAPAFTTADDGWTAWMIDGVIDRAGRAAPVYRRTGRGDDLVVVLGPSVPCLEPVTCGIERPEPPGDLGFLARRGPLGDQPAVFIPSWTDDLHVGRATDAVVPGLDDAQQFVGAENVERTLAAIDAGLDRTGLGDTAPERIVLAGIDGGGVGTLVHVSTIAERFPDTEITVLIDGMVVPGRDTFNECLLAGAQQIWGATVPSTDARAADVEARTARLAPNARFVVIVYRDDPALRRFLAIGRRRCTGESGPLPLADYAAAIEAMSADVPRWRIVVLDAAGHGVLDRPDDDPVTDRVLDALAGNS
ncbi:MAG: hypothetical protein ACSLFO_13115 [Acidimicrobiales bacterium]